MTHLNNRVSCEAIQVLHLAHELLAALDKVLDFVGGRRAVDGQDKLFTELLAQMLAVIKDREVGLRITPVATRAGTRLVIHL